MKLTGKCKDDFLNYCKQSESFINTYADIYLNSLIIEWFDSVGLFIDCGYYAKGKMCSGIESENFSFISTGTRHETRLNALNSAIEKANELYNNQKPKGE